ncbi:hypothetical protein [Sulfuriroseicoccus oceanibius]|uniref:Lipoprotein n=1 Tax=Sulfuriroseicoccus oceanibius TaxID=2707525 RepID=A0A6B3L8R3_9BACT|nr:hypothetical protein [Sulfuriroseicoccus oceanibius]QQL43851.1 hypothetical protein G3M56_008060 [Sulfuriroseicoccus oceanibius]
MRWFLMTALSSWIALGAALGCVDRHLPEGMKSVEDALGQAKWVVVGQPKVATVHYFLNGERVTAESALAHLRAGDVNVEAAYRVVLKVGMVVRGELEEDELTVGWRERFNGHFRIPRHAMRQPGVWYLMGDALEQNGSQPVFWTGGLPPGAGKGEAKLVEQELVAEMAALPVDRYFDLGEDLLAPVLWHDEPSGIDRCHVHDEALSKVEVPVRYGDGVGRIISAPDDVAERQFPFARRWVRAVGKPGLVPIEKALVWRCGACGDAERRWRAEHGVSNGALLRLPQP